MRRHNNEIWLSIKLFYDSIAPRFYTAAKQSRNPFFSHVTTSHDLARICFASGLATIRKTIPPFHYARLTLSIAAREPREVSRRDRDCVFMTAKRPATHVSADYYVVKIIV